MTDDPTTPTRARDHAALLRELAAAPNYRDDGFVSVRRDMLKAAANRLEALERVAEAAREWAEDFREGVLTGDSARDLAYALDALDAGREVE